MSNIQFTVEELNKMQPLDIITSEAVRSRFIQLYDTLWGAGNGLSAYEREAIYFNNILRDNEKLQKATKFSIFNSFIDLAVCGLSLEPGVRALCYLQGRNYCIGQDQTGRKIYEGRLVLTISGYGELVLRTRAGQIRHADNPVLVYAEDTFSFTDQNGSKQVSYTCNLPHTSNHIVAAYLRITRADGSADYAVMLEEDWLRLKEFSEENNKYWDKDAKQWVKKPNELYVSNEGSIDSGFLCAKLIKHAFKTYPKVRIGKAELESQQSEEQQPDIDSFYVDGSQPAQAPQQDATPYGNQPDTSTGVTVDPAQTGGEDDGTF